MNTILIDAITNAMGAWEEYADQLREVIRLANEAMTLTGQEMKVSGVEDFSTEIKNEITKGEENIDWDYVKKLIKERDAKIKRGEFDELKFNYNDAMKGLSMEDPLWITYAILRNRKIDKYGLNETKTVLPSWIPKDLLQFRSGGYTGEWGPEGKLAMLHEKELVLNKQDTANFLTATQMLREISQMLDNNALVASLGAINLHAMTVGNPADQILQQEVTIHADFPNVTDHNEIEIAIDNLINAASQHAFKS